MVAYWTSERRRELAATIGALGASRDLTWIYLEQPSESEGLPTPVLRGVHHDPDHAALVCVAYRNGRRTVQRLADTDAHAHVVHWLAAGKPGVNG